MSFPRYPKYKQSGVEWLGEVPEGWSMRSSRHIFKLANEPSRAEDDQLSSTQKYGVVPQSLFMEIEGHKVALALSGTGNFKHVEENDFVISLRSFQGGIERSKYKGCVSPAYTVLRAAEPIDANYWSFLLKSRRYIQILQTMNDGLRDGKSISYQQFARIPLPSPPLPEQKAIAEFLDRETGKIDELVEEQRSLIALLKEKRQAVISHAVTKGLNPHAPMKHSGIEWLGEVPEGWSVKRIKFIFKIGRGRVIAQDELIVDAQYPVYSSQTLDDGCLGFIETYDFDCSQLTWTTDGANAGTVFLRRGKHNCTNVCGTLQLKTHSQKLEYAYYFLQYATQFYKRPDTNGAKIMNGEMAEIYLSLPPLSEQQAIVEYLEAETSKFDTLTTEAQRAIELLQERRTALISAAVTGQIDVRHYSPNH
jgi:type I restriction enzyme S subunit